MTAETWLIIVALGVLALWIIGGVIDNHAADEELPPVAQPVRHTSPPLPSRARGDLSHARPAADGTGRHRRVGGHL